MKKKKQSKEQIDKDTERAFRKNYKVSCMVCEQKPTVGDLGLCGPCTWGEADTYGGNW